MARGRASAKTELERMLHGDYEFNMGGSQADRVICKFGGPCRLSRIFKAIGRPRSLSSIYLWLYPKSRRGTGGLIPTQAWDDIFRAARYEGIVITPEDLDPRHNVMFREKGKERAFPKRINGAKKTEKDPQLR